MNLLLCSDAPKWKLFAETKILESCNGSLKMLILNSAFGIIQQIVLIFFWYLSYLENILWILEYFQNINKY